MTTETTANPAITERTQGRRTFAPHADILETDNNIVIVADMPGVDENSIDITLEKNVLSINGSVEPNRPDNHNLAYAEFETANYQRSFTLSDTIDQDNIEATVKDGVLNLTLLKISEALPRKIAVRAA